MSDLTMQAVSEKEEKPDPPELNLNFPTKWDVQPDGFDKISLGGEVTVVVRGSVIRAESNPESKWNPGRSLTLRITACQIVPTDAPADTAKKMYPEMK